MAFTPLALTTKWQLAITLMTSKLLQTAIPIVVTITLNSTLKMLLGTLLTITFLLIAIVPVDDYFFDDYNSYPDQCILLTFKFCTHKCETQYNYSQFILT